MCHGFTMKTNDTCVCHGFPYGSRDPVTHFFNASTRLSLTPPPFPISRLLLELHPLHMLLVDIDIDRVDNTADSTDITQSHSASHHRLLIHVTLGLVECRK